MLTPEQERNIDRARRQVSIEHSISGDHNLAYEAISKLVSAIVDCEDEGMSLKVEFFGVRRVKDKK